MEVKIWFCVFISLVISFYFSISMKSLLSRSNRYFFILVPIAVASHFLVASIFMLGSTSNKYLFSSLINVVLLIIANIIFHQIARLRLARDLVKGSLLSVFVVLTFSWVLLFGTGNGQGAGVSPLPSAFVVPAYIYYGVPNSLEAFFFTSALVQAVLVYALFWNSVQYHFRKPA